MFLAFVEYLDWNGGVAGAKADGFLHLMVGRVAVLAPALLVAVGAAVFLRSRLLEVRPLRTGVALAVVGSVLAFSTTSTLTAERHGGLIGSYLRTLLEGFIGSIGVSILVVLLLVAAVVLITGGSIGLAMRSSGRAMAQAAGAGARFSEDMVRLVRERPSSRPRLEAVRSPAQPRGAPLDGSQEFADIFADLPEPEAEPPADTPDPAADSVPAGSDPAFTSDDTDTGEVTEAPPLAMPATRTPYRLPPSSILKRTRAIATSTQDHERVARQLLEALASFGVEARLIGMVSGPGSPATSCSWRRGRR